MKMQFRNAIAHVSLLLAAISGCSDGPELGEVEGKVTLNEKAVPFAYVTFQPVDPPGTYGSAYTEVDGTFKIKFSGDRDGAPVGKHLVSIRTAAKDEIEVEDKSTGLMVKPDLPEGYQEKVELFFDREVSSGSNEINFDLKEGRSQTEKG